MTEPEKVPTGLVPWACLAFLPRLGAAARGCGYALAVHGSMARDFDLVAVPWTADAAAVEDLVEAVRAAVGGVLGSEAHRRPHGRLGFVIHLGGGPYIDLSVMPLRPLLPPEDSTVEMPEPHG